MILGFLDRVVGTVTTHSKTVIAVMLVATVVVGAGAADIPGPGNEELGADSEEQAALDYIQANYGTDTENVAAVPVYVRDSGGNVLSRSSMLATLRYQQSVLESEAVARIAHDHVPVSGISNHVARRLASEEEPTIAEQVDAMEAADEATVRETVRREIADEPEAQAALPRNYEQGTAVAESRRMVFVLEGQPEDVWNPSGPVAEAQEEIYDRIDDPGETERYFMLTGPAVTELQTQATTDTLLFIGPIAIVLIVAALAFAYRDVIDVLVAMVGVVVTLIWMFGLVGWLDVPWGNATIIAPILLIGLSIDYGLHVFMRYREERAPGEAVRPPMRRALAGISVALVLVTTTTALGFLSNLTSPLSDIRVLILATVLGIVGAMVVFVTLVPAVKVEVDEFLERHGRDRRRPSIGKAGTRARRGLTLGVAAARRSALAVVVIALLLTVVSGAAFGALDSSVGSQPEQPADWQQSVPEPFGMDEYPLLDDERYVSENFQRAGPGVDPAQILIEGDVATPDALLRMHRAEDRFATSGVAFQRDDGTIPTQSPLTVMQQVADRNPEFAATLEAADVDGDGVPDRNVAGVLDGLFEHAPEDAAEVIERRGGEYTSARLLLPAAQSDDFTNVAKQVRRSASLVDGGEGVAARATGQDVIIQVQIEILTENILQTLVLALLVIFVLLSVLYRVSAGSATLGAITVLPIGMILAWVFGAMYVLAVPLTLLTALLMSLAVGLGTDYTIHITERFSQELEAGASPDAAIETAVAGTGGALLGSTATTVAAFGTLSLSPFPDVQQLGLLVALALLCSLAVAVFVLPSLLTLWSRHVYDGGGAPGNDGGADGRDESGAEIDGGDGGGEPAEQPGTT